MLKRYQILLDDWLADYMKYRADNFGTSFSECTRVALCMYYICMLPEEYPEHKIAISIEDMKEMVKKYLVEPHDQTEMDEALSKVYFEARKAIEYAWNKDKEDKSNA